MSQQSCWYILRNRPDLSVIPVKHLINILELNSLWSRQLRLISGLIQLSRLL